MFGLIRKKILVKIFAEYLAELQKKADRWFYISKNQEMSSFVLNEVAPVKELASRFGICSKVYEEAYKIYDFRNSGKKDLAPDLEKLKK